jgi:hypothetical protein
MKRKKKTQFDFGPSTLALVESTQALLNERGVFDFNVGTLIEFLVLSASPATIDQFVSEQTPMEYKIKMLLKNESAAKELLKLANKHDFGAGLRPRPE